MPLPWHSVAVANLKTGRSMVALGRPWKYLAPLLVAIACVATNSAALEENAVEIGFVIPMTGPQSAGGRQVAGGERPYVQQYGHPRASAHHTNSFGGTP